MDEKKEEKREKEERIRGDGKGGVEEDTILRTLHSWTSSHSWKGSKLNRIDPEKRTGSWEMMAMRERRRERGMDLMSTPSTRRRVRGSKTDGDRK